MKRLVLITATVSLGAAGLAAAAPTATASPTAAAAKIAWAKCPTDVPGGSYLANAECGQLTVPVDYRRPKGKKISIAVSRVKATDKAHYQGVLIGNPGGPGGSGLYLSGGLASWLPKEVAAKYDIIGFDPRGVGISKPALSCQPNYNVPPRPDYVPRTKAIEAKWLKRSKGYAAACAKKFGWLLPHMRTTDAAKDLNSLRLALGQKKISYYGFSYGTYLGATYATLFPKTVRRMVLDGNVKPSEVWYDAQLSQDKAFERNIKLWFAWIAKYDSVYHLGKTGKAVEAAYYKALNASRTKPIGGKIGPAELTDIVLSAGYNTAYYPLLAAPLSAWITKKDPAPLLEWVDLGGDDNGFAVYNAVQAVDAKWPRNWKKWHNDAARLYKAGYRFETWGNVWFNAPIAFWKVPGGPRVKLSGKGLPRIMLVQATLDAATPYAGGLEMRKVLPSSTLIAELGGKTHSNTLNGNACLDDKVAAYLSTGALAPRKKGKGPDVTCKAVPALNNPVPPSSASTLSAQSVAKPARPLIGRP